MAKVHIGKKIREVLKKSPYGATEFAAMISMTRAGLYKIFEKESIATDLLQKISRELNHDFFSYYQESIGVANDPAPKYGYALREDVEALTRLVNTLARQIEKVQKDVSKIANDKKVKRKK